MLCRYTPLAILLLTGLAPLNAPAQSRIYDSTSMSIMSTDTYGRECYRAASIAARIHYTSSGDLESCDVALNHTAMSVRDRAATFTNRGIIYMALEKYPEAIRDYNMALKLKPELGEIYVNIGNVYYLGKVYDKAVIEYTNALERGTSRSHIALINRGMAYEHLAEFDKAEADYRKVQEMLPDSALAQVRLDQLLRKREEYKKTGRMPGDDT